MKDSHKIKVLIVDDHRLFREGLIIMLGDTEGIEVVGDAQNGKDAMIKVRDLNPDIVLMDLEMPELGGVDAIRIILHNFPPVKILALTSFEDDEHIYTAMQGGAVGYVIKRVGRDELVKIIKTAYRGEVLFSPFLANIVLQKVNAKRSEIRLTSSEMKILKHIVEGYSNERISDTIYISKDTVKAHLKSIYKKLQVKTRTEAAVEAIRRGLV